MEQAESALDVLDKKDANSSIFKLWVSREMFVPALVLAVWLVNGFRGLIALGGYQCHGTNKTVNQLSKEEEPYN